VAQFGQLFSITLFAEWFFYMLTTSTVFIFRRREPDAPRPYRTWGYPALPVLFIAASALLLISTFAENLKHPFLMVGISWFRPPFNSLSMMGVVVVLLGIPVYYAFARRQRS